MIFLLYIILENFRYFLYFIKTIPFQKQNIPFSLFLAKKYEFSFLTDIKRSFFADLPLKQKLPISHDVRSVAW